MQSQEQRPTRNWRLGLARTRERRGWQTRVAPTGEVAAMAARGEARGRWRLTSSSRDTPRRGWPQRQARRSRSCGATGRRARSRSPSALVMGLAGPLWTWCSVQSRVRSVSSYSCGLLDSAEYGGPNGARWWVPAVPAPSRAGHDRSSTLRHAYWPQAFSN